MSFQFKDPVSGKIVERQKTNLGTRLRVRGTDGSADQFLDPDASENRTLRDAFATAEANRPQFSGLPERQTDEKPDSLMPALKNILPANFATSADLASNFEKSIEDIRSRRAKDISQRFATIKGEEREMGGRKVEGVKAIAEGAKQGVRGFSSAELSLIQDQESKNAKRMRDIDSAEERALLDNDTAALSDLRAERKERTTLALNYSNLIINAFRAKTAAELGAKAEERMGRTEDRLTEQGAIAMETAISNMTGEFRGSPTFAASRQATLEALQIAGLTGEFNGEPTLAAQQNIINNAFKQAGIDLQEQSLSEQIRSNKVQEAIARMKVANSGISNDSGLTDSELSLLVPWSEKEGAYVLSVDNLDLLVSQKGLDRLRVAGVANEMADKLNAQNAQKREELLKQAGEEEAFTAKGFGASIRKLPGAFGEKVIGGTVKGIGEFGVGLIGEEAEQGLGGFWSSLFGDE